MKTQLTDQIQFCKDLLGEGILDESQGQALKDILAGLLLQEELENSGRDCKLQLIGARLTIAELIFAVDYLKSWIADDGEISEDLERRVRSFGRRPERNQETAKEVLVGIAKLAIERARTVDVKYKEAIDLLQDGEDRPKLIGKPLFFDKVGLDLGDPKGDRIVVLGADITDYSDDELTEMLSEIESDYNVIKDIFANQGRTTAELEKAYEATHYKTSDLSLLRESADVIRKRLKLIE